jgi:hypothetical protein
MAGAHPARLETGLPVENEEVKARMNVPVKPESSGLAQDRSWTAEYRDGYERGRRARTLNQIPPRHLLIGLSDHAAGFRAGYCADAPDSPRTQALGRSR